MSSCVLDLARRRKTVRRFSSKPVNLKDVLVALEAACQAPSGANTQPWRFLIVTDPQIRRRVRETCEEGEKKFYSAVRGDLKLWLSARGFSWEKPFLKDAPLLILVFSEAKAPYATESVWSAIGYILLGLEELGLGTVTYTPSITKGVLEAMSIPEGYRLEAILPVGVSADSKPKEPRLNLQDVSYLNQWGHRLAKA